MNIYFLLNNLHFALEILGALAFLIAAWFTFDTYLLRRNFLTASRAFGFFMLSAWQIIHALGTTDAAWSYAGFPVYLLGPLLIVLSLFLERSASRPKLNAILILPPIVASMFYANAIVAFFYALIAFLSFRQYKAESNATLKPFWLGFIFLFLGAILSVFYKQDFFDTLWIAGHVFEAVGFGALAVWVWQYLKLRVREEMILIFVSVALLISIVVTLAFSIILVNQIEETAKNGLLTNAKVLDLSISRLKEEALAKTKLLSRTAGFEEMLVSRDFAKLEEETSKYLKSEKLGFLIIVDKSGEVVLRAHALTQKEDNIFGESAVSAALGGGMDFVAIESSPAEKFSIRVASPLILNDEIVGAVVAGFLLDNALADNIKRITGLEMSIYEMGTIVATTLLNQDGRTRITGGILTDDVVRTNVLERGEEVITRTEILARPAIAGYIPIKNENGVVIGMLSSIKPQQEILELANTTNRMTFATVVILMLILSVPIYLLTKRLSIGV